MLSFVPHNTNKAIANDLQNTIGRHTIKLNWKTPNISCVVYTTV
jgi:hypothetical protein